MNRINSLYSFCLLGSVLVSVSGAVEEPSGRLLLKSVFIDRFLQEATVNYINATLTCSVLNGAGRIYFKYPIQPKIPGLGFLKGKDISVTLLSHESVECELTEVMENDELANSHGSCEFTYARFLAPNGNEVTCTLSDGSAFVLKMDCGGPCPIPTAAPRRPYCKRSKQLLPVDIGKSHSFTDGSPGFSMYSPNSRCSWTIRRERKGAINFVFSRLDLGGGDHIKIYGSPNGKTLELIKIYNSRSVPESASTLEKYMVIELVTDDNDEGLGFSGFYYFTEQKTSPVQITPGKESGDDSSASPSPSVGRKLLVEESL